MQEAKKVPIDIDSTLILNVKRSAAWELLKDLKNWDKIYGSAIATFDVQGDTGDRETAKLPDLEMTVVFADKTVRKYKLTQFQPEDRFIVLKVVEPEQQGINESYIGLVLNVDTETSCKFKFFARVDGPEPSKTSLVNQMKKEMRIFIGSFQKKLQSVN